MSRFKSIIIIASMLLLISSIIMGISQKSTISYAATTIKIMPCGDSVTAGIGSTGNGSYRTDLYKHYTNAGLSIDFVGSQSSGPSSLPDKNHEGHSGWTIPQIVSNVNSWLNTYNPDVMLLMIGGNDTLQGVIPTSRLSSLIDQITNLKPNLILFVADYYYSLPNGPNYNAIVQYDAEIPGMIKQKANAGKRVYFVKLSDANFSTSEYADGLHPTDSGYSKLAKIWYDSTISILQGTTPTPTPTLNPSPTPTPTVGPTVSPTVGPTVSPTPTPTVSGNYAVAYSMNDWGNGATVSITIKNNSTAAVNGWTLNWTFSGNQKITNMWNATYTQNGASVSTKNVGYNGAIPAGGSVNFGFNISYSGSNTKPSGFTLNGSACEVN
jgi:lysophospholipase L1-like esterase